MTCGNDYTHMLVTEDGKTPGDPWDWFAGPLDYDAWYDVAHVVGREVFRRWNWLLSIEDKLSKLKDPEPGDVYPERDQLLYLLGEFATVLDDLGHVLMDPFTHPEWTWEPAIRRAIAAAQDGLCVLEKIDEATEHYQQPPLPQAQPSRKPGTGKPDTGDDKSGGGVGGVLMTGALAVGGLLLWRRHKHKEQHR